MVGGPELDTSVIRSALKGEKREKGKKKGEREAAYVMVSPELYW